MVQYYEIQKEGIEEIMLVNVIDILLYSQIKIGLFSIAIFFIYYFLFCVFQINKSKHKTKHLLLEVQR